MDLNTKIHKKCIPSKPTLVLLHSTKLWTRFRLPVLWQPSLCDYSFMHFMIKKQSQWLSKMEIYQHQYIISLQFKLLSFRFYVGGNTGKEIYWALPTNKKNKQSDRDLLGGTQKRRETISERKLKKKICHHIFSFH